MGEVQNGGVEGCGGCVRSRVEWVLGVAVGVVWEEGGGRLKGK